MADKYLGVKYIVWSSADSLLENYYSGKPYGDNVGVVNTQKVMIAGTQKKSKN